VHAPDSDVVVEDWVQTADGRVHVAAVPVRVEGGDDTGTYVVGASLGAALGAQGEIMRTFALVSVVVLLGVGVVAWLVMGRVLRPLELLAATARQVGESDLHRRAPVRGDDDVAALARTFNTMLDRLSDAIEAQRQFLDDAGHELRTPLTVLRGHLELIDPDDTRDVVETRDLLLDETARMSRIVEDLVLLAKSERPDFLAPAPVDLGRLTDDLLDKARALGDRRWLVDARADAVVLGDAQRLTQAGLQLAHNAVKFTAPGTVIAVGTEVSDGVARLWVRDEGPGVAPEDRRRIFDRFARTDGAAGIDGSGLGLAIVRAIAQGHGGDVAATDGGGRGLRVTLAWPADADRGAAVGRTGAHATEGER
jgi:two-component system OmpR family sensor kinase